MWELIATFCRPEVQSMALWMEIKLRENDDKGGWTTCETSWLIGRLREEVDELEADLDRGIHGTIILREAADICNFAMMVADVACGGLVAHTMTSQEIHSCAQGE